MGYCINGGGTITLREGADEECLAALRKMDERDDKKSGGGGGELWFAFANGMEFSNVATIEDVFEIFRIEAKREGQTFNLTFAGEKMGDEEFLAETIAPFVAEGKVEWYGEDGEHWAWQFSDGNYDYARGTVTLATNKEKQ